MLIITEVFSEGVSNEKVAWQKYESTINKMLDASTPEEYIETGDSLAPTQYLRLLPKLSGSSLDILDVGVGAGQSSMLLALNGHRVWAVEPHDKFCEVIEQQAQNFCLPIVVCRGVGEDIDKINNEFDMVIFNSSLHHCDNPAKVLAHCYDSLKPGGNIFLVNELFLRPWMTKARFYHLLETQPVVMGHYGGNEHAYYNWEYVRMLRAAGFHNLSYTAPFLQTAVERIEGILSSRLNGERRYKSGCQIILRLLYYMIEGQLRKTKIINALLSRVSIYSSHFTGKKPNSPPHEDICVARAASSSIETI